MRRLYTALKKARLAWYLEPQAFLIVAATAIQLIGMMLMYL